VSRRRVLVVLAALLMLGWVLWARCGVRGCPNVGRLTAYQPGGAPILYDAGGEPFADLAPVDYAVVRLDSLPDYVSAAFVAIEDKRFHEHNGVDYRRVLGAALADIKAGGFVQGFSTITMQLARNVWADRLPGQQRTLRRKILEVRVAREIEDRYSKDEILELYLNHIYFGSGAYGIEAAARNYFGKSAKDLTLSQAATLAAMPKSPTIYNPRRNPDRAKTRRDLVLAQMVQQGRITVEEANRAERLALNVRRDPPRSRTATQVAPYFADAVRRVLEDALGEDLYTGTLAIHTTLDRRAQRIAEEELRTQLRLIEAGEYGRYRGERYRSGALEQDPAYLQGAVVMMEAATGEVRALVGGRDYQQSRFDRATRARRQAGSAFKPFVYAAALSDGYAPSQLILDEPIRLELPGGEVWEPQNAGGETEGKVSMREALVRSKNLPTIRLAADVGLDRVIDVAHESGIRSDIPKLPSIAIGTAAVTPLELTAAYTPLANFGEAVAPRMVTRVVDANGKIVWESRPRKRNVLNPGVAYLVTDMLEDALRSGTGTRALRAGYRGAAAGKTGTTNDGSDAWFVGYNPALITTVWIGFDRPAAIVSNASGGRLAAPVWGRIMNRVYSDRKAPREWERPERVIERKIDPGTGLVLRDGCRPEQGRSRTELFLRGDEPPTSCPRGEPTDGRENLFVRLVAGLARTGGSAVAWVRGLFTEEEPVEPKRPYLGVPRLPTRTEAPRDTAPAWGDSFPVPEIQVETLRIEQPDSILLLGEPIPLPTDTMRADSLRPRPDTVRRDTTRRDTIRRDTIRSRDPEAVARAGNRGRLRRAGPEAIAEAIPRTGNRRRLR